MLPCQLDLNPLSINLQRALLDPVRHGGPSVPEEVCEVALECPTNAVRAVISLHLLFSCECLGTFGGETARGYEGAKGLLVRLQGRAPMGAKIEAAQARILTQCSSEVCQHLLFGSDLR